MKYPILVGTVSALIFFCTSCAHEDVWKEEVRLSNGDLLVLDRENFYGDFENSNIYKPPVTAYQLKFSYKNQRIGIRLRRLIPIALQIDEHGALFIVSVRNKQVACAGSDKYLSKYLIFKYLDGKWVQVHRRDIPENVVANLSGSAKTLHSTTFKEYVTEDDYKLNATNVRYLTKLLPPDESEVEECVPALPNNSLQARRP